MGDPSLPVWSASRYRWSLRRVLSQGAPTAVAGSGDEPVIGHRHVQPFWQIVGSRFDVLEFRNDITRHAHPFADITIGRIPFSLRSARLAASRTVSVRPPRLRSSISRSTTGKRCATYLRPRSPVASNAPDSNPVNARLGLRHQIAPHQELHRCDLP